MKLLGFILWIRKTIKSRDIFSKQISLTYQGEDSYSTLIGGVISIAISCVLISYGVIRFMTMINRGNSSTSFNKVVSDLTTSGSVLNLGTSTFYFAMYLPYNGKNLLTDSTYIDLQMNYVVHQSGKQTSTSISYDI